MLGKRLPADLHNQLWFQKLLWRGKGRKKDILEEGRREGEGKKWKKRDRGSLNSVRQSRQAAFCAKVG